MMHKSIVLARVIVRQINSKYSFLCADLSDDFYETGNILIESLISCGSLPIGDFVFSKLSPYYRRHLLFRFSDESANISYWKVV